MPAASRSWFSGNSRRRYLPGRQDIQSRYPMFASQALPLLLAGQGSHLFSLLPASCTTTQMDRHVVYMSSNHPPVLGIILLPSSQPVSAEKRILSQNPAVPYLQSKRPMQSDEPQPRNQNHEMCLILGLLGTAQETSSPGSNETRLLTLGSVPRDGRSLTDMLMVTL
jgi:hypothetical protein